MAANPYVQGWREWDERYADLVLGKRNWQIAADQYRVRVTICATGIAIVPVAICRQCGGISLQR